MSLDISFGPNSAAGDPYFIKLSNAIIENKATSVTVNFVEGHVIGYNRLLSTLGHSTTVKSVYIGNGNFGSYNSDAVASMLASNNNMRTVRLHGGDMSNGMYKIISALENNWSLEKLIVAPFDNVAHKISPKFIEKIICDDGPNMVLTHLDIYNTPLTERTKARLADNKAHTRVLRAGFSAEDMRAAETAETLVLKSLSREEVAYIADNRQDVLTHAGLKRLVFANLGETSDFAIDNIVPLVPHTVKVSAYST
jgi:hypothetical protein